MSFRGRGRGRGGFGFGGSFQSHAKQEECEIFPEIIEFPEVNLKQKEENYKALVSWSNDLQKFWLSSPYHYEGTGQGSKRKPPLSDYMKMTDDYVPAELGIRNARRSNKKVRWDPQSDLQRLDVLEKLDQGPQGQDDEKEKKEDEEDDENNENVEDEEEDSGDDYDQNVDFDDDEDDFNMPDDGGDDEGFY